MHNFSSPHSKDRKINLGNAAWSRTNSSQASSLLSSHDSSSGPDTSTSMATGSAEQSQPPGAGQPGSRGERGVWIAGKTVPNSISWAVALYIFFYIFFPPFVPWQNCAGHTAPASGLASYSHHLEWWLTAKSLMIFISVKGKKERLHVAVVTNYFHWHTASPLLLHETKMFEDMEHT